MGVVEESLLPPERPVTSVHMSTLRIPCLCSGGGCSICARFDAPATDYLLMLKHEKFLREKKEKALRLRRWKAFNRQARRRGWEVSITYEHYSALLKLPCAYCCRSPHEFGIDRVRNEEGYSPRNALPCCSRCNFMKGRLALRDFLESASRISRFVSRFGVVE